MTTVSRRQALVSLPAAAAALTPGTANALGELPRASADDDPVFGAIARCATALAAWERSLMGEDWERSLMGDPGPMLQLLDASEDAIVAWLTTTPTTMAGVVATLAYASERDGERDDERGLLLESANYPGERLGAAAQFPAMIAAALRRISS